MNIDLLRLKNAVDKKIEIDESLSFAKELLEGTDLLDLKEICIHGFIERSVTDGFYVHVEAEGIMVLPCSISLLPTDYPFGFEIDGDLLTLLQEIDENVKKVENTIDLLPIIWENILMEIPMRVVNEKASSIKTEGEGWKLITDDEQDEIVNPEFKKLIDLLERKEV